MRRGKLFFGIGALCYLVTEFSEALLPLASTEFFKGMATSWMLLGAVLILLGRCQKRRKSETETERMIYQ